MKKLISIFLLLLGSLISCAEQPDTEPIDDDYTSEVLRRAHDNSSISYGRYIYRAGNSGVGLRRYDRITGEYTSACITPDCDGSCYVERMAQGLAGVMDHKIIFGTNPIYTGIEDQSVWSYVSCDVVTGEEIMLVTLDYTEFNDAAVALWDGYLYYLKKVLKEGGDASNSDDYENALCRVSIHGGNDEIVYRLEHYILPHFVIDGQLYYSYDRVISKMDLSTGETQLVADAETIGYTSIVAECYYDGYIYCSTGDGSTFTDEQGKVFPKVFLARVNIATGEIEVLTQYSGDFIVTEAGIYFGKAESIVYLYIPPEGKEDEEETIFNYVPTLCFCNLDGSGVKEVFHRETWDYDVYEVVGTIVYMGISQFDETNRCWQAEKGIYAVNLTDGSYTKSVYEKPER